MECAGYQLKFSLCHTMFSDAVFSASFNLGLAGKGLKGQYMGWCNIKREMYTVRFEMAIVKKRENEEK